MGGCSDRSGLETRNSRRMLEFQRGVKEVFELLFACLGLAAMLPAFAAIALGIKLTSPGPVFFIQNRVGRYERTFRFIKFRTMVEGAEHIGLGLAVAHDDARITPIGKYLRQTSLDELPQLINVLRGEMSLIGPRPTVPEQVARYSSYQRRRLEVKPGVTGWAQVNGRNDLEWVDRIDLDIWYIDHWSLLLDFSILIRTVAAVVRREGLYGGTGITKDLG